MAGERGEENLFGRDPKGSAGGRQEPEKPATVPACSLLVDELAGKPGVHSGVEPSDSPSRSAQHSCFATFTA